MLSPDHRKQKIITLALSFPTLTEAEGLEPWNPRALVRWARTPAAGHAAREAVRFVLSVWDPVTNWRCGRFNLHEALQGWDDEHRAAFSAWAKSPWWA